MSDAWLKEQERFAARVLFEGVCWKWPSRRTALRLVQRTARKSA